MLQIIDCIDVIDEQEYFLQSQASIGRLKNIQPFG